MPERCLHDEFRARVDVHRLVAKEGDTEATGYLAEIRIECAKCSVRMQFLGLEPGCDTQGARVSLDGLEASIGLAPEGTRPNPFQRLSYNIDTSEHN